MDLSMEDSPFTITLMMIMALHHILAFLE